MRLTLLLLLVCGAAFADDQANPDFPQTQAQPVQNTGGGNPDFQQTYDEPNQDMGTAPQNPYANQPQLTDGDSQDRGGRNEGNSRQNGGKSGRNGGYFGAAMKQGPEKHLGDNGEDLRNDDGQPDGEDGGDVDGASENFATVVKAYVAKKSVGGYWTYVEKKGKKRKSWRLLRPSIEDGSVRRKAGSIFSGLATLREAHGKGKLELMFEVDFSGAKWRVVAVKPARRSAVSSRR